MSPAQMIDIGFHAALALGAAAGAWAAGMRWIERREAASAMRRKDVYAPHFDLARWDGQDSVWINGVEYDVSTGRRSRRQ